MELKIRIYADLAEGCKMIVLDKGDFDNGIWFSSPEHIDEYASSPMLFTGLKDKNGVDIYQDDYITNGDDLCLVVWRDDLASFALRKDGWMYDHFFGEAVDPGYVEVIANTYEKNKLQSWLKKQREKQG